MKVLVCGGRDFENKRLMSNILEELKLDPEKDLIITGGARGADQMAEVWAMNSEMAFMSIPAVWSRKGKSAGILRNLRMLEEKPDLVVAFPGGNGTAHMIRVATEAGIEVRKIL